MRRLRVFLDANVIVDAQLRDLFLRFAERGLVTVAWSGDVLAEVARVLVDRLGLAEAPVQRLLKAMREAFPEASVVGFEHRIEGLPVPDPDDRHVLAASLEVGADLLVTFNGRDFPDGPHMGDLEAVVPDDALVAAIHAGPAVAVEGMEAAIAALRRPPVTPEQFLERLSVRAPIAAIVLGAAYRLPLYERLLDDIGAAQGPTSPQAVVDVLLDALVDGDEDTIRNCLTPELSGELVGVHGHRPGSLLAVLRRQLGDVLTSDGWGFGTAKRPVAPGIEYVKLIQGGDQPLVALTPRFAPGHLFKVIDVERRRSTDRTRRRNGSRA